MPYERWLPVPSERDCLIEEVKHGRLTPDQAELEVSRLGQEPLQFTPNPDEFDPMKEPTWSLLMTLAWIMWRSTDVVREMRDDYRKACRVWAFYDRWGSPGGPINTGHWLESKPRAELLDLNIATAGDRPSVVKNSSEAFRLLKNEAQRAKWKATGIPLDGSRRREILPIEWIDFRIERVRGAGVRQGQDLGYDECRFPVDGVTKSFPACGVGTGAAKTTVKRGRGDFTKVKEAVNAVYPQGIPTTLNDSDVLRRVDSHLRLAGGKVPNERTMRKHITKIRSS